MLSRLFLSFCVKKKYSYIRVILHKNVFNLLCDSRKPMTVYLILFPCVLSLSCLLFILIVNLYNEGNVSISTICTTHILTYNFLLSIYMFLYKGLSVVLN